jgi:hypothetical protein
MARIEHDDIIRVVLTSVGIRIDDDLAVIAAFVFVFGIGDSTPCGGILENRAKTVIIGAVVLMNLVIITAKIGFLCVARLDVGIGVA